MDNGELLIKLKGLVSNNGFDSHEEAIEWADELSSLLQQHPNTQYYNAINQPAYEFRIQLSADRQTNNYNIMKSELRKSISELEAILQDENLQTERHFAENSHLAIQKYIKKILLSAQTDLWICDAYADHVIIEELDEVIANGIKILTTKGNKKPLFSTRLNAARTQLNIKSIEVKTNTNIHDRYIIIDQCEVWQIGTSYNDKAGGKQTSISKFEEPKAKQGFIDTFNNLWSKATDFQ